MPRSLILAFTGAQTFLTEIMNKFSCVEICAGAGGQALGLEKAGFYPEALVEIDRPSRETLLYNRPKWNVICDEQSDVRLFKGAPYRGIDLLAGGVPCPPFSVAGKQLGKDDERDLFPEALRLVDECRPRAVLLENVRGFLGSVFCDYRASLKKKFRKMGYCAEWRLLNASDFGVSQLRPRVVIVAVRKCDSHYFDWPSLMKKEPPTVGELLCDLMKVHGWHGALNWVKHANKIAPTIVGGSKKHGGADLGPTRAKAAWRALGVDGMGIADDAPAEHFAGMPRLTVDMVARIQGFPDSWTFAGKKTPAYRQIGNAFPPPVAKAVARKIFECLARKKIYTQAA